MSLAQVLSAAYSPAQPDQLRQEGRVSGLYLMMGRGLERLQVISEPSSSCLGWLWTLLAWTRTPSGDHVANG